MSHRYGIPIVSLFLALLAASVPSMARAQADTTRQLISTITNEEMEALLSGSGSGAGRPAEVNGYPGPKRLMEHAVELGLNADQLAKVKSLNQGMKSEAMDLGKRIVERETALDALLKSGSSDKQALASLVSEIAGLRGRMRLIHLQLHFALRALLTDEQLLLYRTLSAEAGKKK
jgi:hypothetical protein